MAQLGRKFDGSHVSMVGWVVNRLNTIQKIGCLKTSEH